MVGTALNVTVDDIAAQDFIARMLDFGGWPMRRFFDSVGFLLANSAKRRFTTQRAPDGSTWKPSIRVLAKGGQTLRLHGFLQRSIIHNVLDGDQGVEIGSPLAYAGIHNNGGTITVFARSQQIYRTVKKDGAISGFVKKAKATLADWITIPGHTITMPKRTFLGIDADDERQINALAIKQGQELVSGVAPRGAP